MTILKWDTNFGIAYDLCIAGNVLLTLGWIRAGLICGIHLGTPCQSFSRIRGLGIGPPAIRSDAEPMGLSTPLRPGDVRALQVGNKLLHVSCRVFHACLIHRIPVSLENPATSRLWLTPCIRHLKSRKLVSLTTTEFCMWGKPWRKSTSFLSAFLDLTTLQERRCLGAPRGLWLRTGKPHRILFGRAPNGSWWTKVAEPHPATMCRCLASAFISAIASHRALCLTKWISG